jgi:hypothetical protein
MVLPYTIIYIFEAHVPCATINVLLFHRCTSKNSNVNHSLKVTLPFERKILET